MKKINEKRLYDKIYACWLGKNVGGTLGAPVEGRMEVMDIKWYPYLPKEGVIPNDDLDLQLVALHAIEQYGPGLTCQNLSDEWKEHVFFPYDEYGYAVTAMRMGFKSPLSGCFDNTFTDCMGSPIRSEIWAAVCAGNPSLAVRYALNDACVDHAGGEGMYGEMFNAAAESIAYVENDIKKIIRKALKYVPSRSKTAKAVRCALGCYEKGMTILEAREDILKNYGSDNFTNAPQNIAFGLCGILWGKDFEDSLLKTVNLGYDTDCTVATCGALLGIMYGRDYIPEKWVAPIGNAVAVSAPVRGMDAPKDLDELTERTIKQYRIIREFAGRENGKTEVPKDFGYQKYTIPEGASEKNGIAVILKYDRPYAAAGRECKVTAVIKNNTCGDLTLECGISCPEGMTSPAKTTVTVKKGTEESVTLSVTVAAAELIHRVNRLRFVITRINDGCKWAEYELPFTLLRPFVWHTDKGARKTEGTLFKFAKNEKRIAESVLNVPETRQTQIICCSKCPVKVELDGKTVMDSRGGYWMPAYHRAPADQRITMNLERGRHSVKITLGEGEDARFVFALTAPAEVSEPGNFYAYIDYTLE